MRQQRRHDSVDLTKVGFTRSSSEVVRPPLCLYLSPAGLAFVDSICFRLAIEFSYGKLYRRAVDRCCVCSNCSVCDQVVLSGGFARSHCLNTAAVRTIVIPGVWLAPENGRLACHFSPARTFMKQRVLASRNRRHKLAESFAGMQVGGVNSKSPPQNVYTTGTYSC